MQMDCLWVSYPPQDATSVDLREGLHAVNDETSANLPTSCLHTWQGLVQPRVHAEMVQICPTQLIESFHFTPGLRFSGQHFLPKFLSTARPQPPNLSKPPAAPNTHKHTHTHTWRCIRRIFLGLGAKDLNHTVCLGKTR